MPTPLYTPETSSNPAYQLNWSYSLFWTKPPVAASLWFEPLRQILETNDHIRLLQAPRTAENVTQFLVSTRPSTSPQLLAQRLKGRLQHLLKKVAPALVSPFRRNYGLRAIGSADRDTVEGYVAKQLEHHAPFADAKVLEKFRQLQIDHTEVIDLSEPEITSHAAVWYDLHLVFVTDSRFRLTQVEQLEKARAMILEASAKKRHLVSKVAILPDHFHLLVRPKPDEAPEEIALSYLNNIAWALGRRRVFSTKYFVGTFGEYGLAGVKRGALTPSGKPDGGVNSIDTTDLGSDLGSTGQARVVAGFGEEDNTNPAATS